LFARGRRLLAEFLGTLLLSAIVVGSGVAAQRLSPGDTGLQLAENAGATALGLFALITVLAPISGAHLNPLVSLVDATLRRRSWIDSLAYVPSQIAGCIAGVLLANAMFGVPNIRLSGDVRATPEHFLSEMIATAGLVLVIFVLARTSRDRYAPLAVGAYIGSAYFFTSSASFANPALTIGRMFSDSFSGIAPSSVPVFLAAQLVGAVIGLGLVVVLTPTASALRT
jgi:glycerol uptake facilitator-like aquaporin